MRLDVLKSCCLVVLCLVPAVAFAQAGTTYEVKITNLTRGQIMSPPVVFSHDEGVSLFEPGQPASNELAALAEDTDSAGLLAMLASHPSVRDVVIDSGPILPGASATLEVSVQGGQRLISFASMLVTTNDSFAAVRGLRTHPAQTVSAMVPAYDAGSEGNNELCAFIPGPPCDNPFQHDAAGAEGYVYINAGVQGVGDLTGMHDWRNPVARVEVRRQR